jgi:hypothetical protein
VKDFDELKTKDREFKVGGELFHWRDVRPEVLTSFTAPDTNGDGGVDQTWALLDAQILLFVAPDEHERWHALRARDDDAVTVQQLTSILTWLMEEQTGRPTETPSPSDPGRGRTAATSKAR